MYVDTFLLLQLLPFLTFDDMKSIEYQEGFDQAVSEVMGIIRTLEEENENIEQLKILCPIWNLLNTGEGNE